MPKLPQLSSAPTELLTLIICFPSRLETRYPSRYLFQRSLSTSSLPRVAQPSLWQSMIPKAFRKQTPSSATEQTSQVSRISWRNNPATPFILLGILCGSQAIHTIKLKNEMDAFSRQTEAKLDKLREVIRRIQNGEKDVDVESILGTGDPQSEKEWADVLKEVNQDDYIWRESKWKQEKKKRREAKEAQSAAAATSQPRGSEPSPKLTEGTDGTANLTAEEPLRRRPRFL